MKMGTAEMATARAAAVARIAGQGIEDGGVEAQMTAGSFRVYDGRAISVGGAGRVAYGTAKAAPEVGSPVHGAGQVLGRMRDLRPPGVAVFSVRHPNEALRALLRPPGGDALIPASKFEFQSAEGA